MPPSAEIELRRERGEYSSESTTKVVGENSIHISEVSVKHTYERISFHSSGNSSLSNSEITSGGVNSIEPVDDSSLNKTANTILSFIENRLQKDLKEGASQEEIESRLQAGLEGFKKGFSEAKEQLDALGLLSGEDNSISKKINATYDGVVSGIESLRNSFLRENDVPTDSAVHDKNQSADKTSNKSSNDQVVNPPSWQPSSSSNASVINTFQNGNVLSGTTESAAKLSSFHQSENTLGKKVETNVSLMESFSRASRLTKTDSADNSIQKQHGVKNSFSFQVETADGDKVTITAKTTDASVTKYNQFNTLIGNGEDLSRYTDKDSHFSIDINGELDEEELNALDDLLKKVENLSVNFFEGNLDLAFNQASNLGYDTDEIVGFSLNLKHVEVEKVKSAYQEFLPARDDSVAQPSSLADQLQPLGSFAKDLMDAAQIATTFKESHSLIVELATNFEKQQAEDDSFENRFSAFVKGLLESGM